MTQLYALDGVDIWHAVDRVYECCCTVRGRCGHEFTPKRSPTARRPHKDEYCAGCKGAEEREAAQKRVGT